MAIVVEFALGGLKGFGKLCLLMSLVNLQRIMRMVFHAFYEILKSSPRYDNQLINVVYAFAIGNVFRSSKQTSSIGGY